MAEVDPYTRRVFLVRVRDFAGGAPFPSTGEELVRFAARRNTPEAIIMELDRLRGREFASLDDVVRAVDAQRYGSATSAG